MSRPVLYIAITNHGFGHAVRAASIAAKIQKLNPDILLVLVTTAPRWLLDSYIEGDFIHRPRGFDVGVIQSDSFGMDLDATLAKLQQIRSQQQKIIAGEVNFIHTNKVGLVLADIPPLAAPIAKAAGIECWMLSNFGWDFIYQDWGGEFNTIADWISECYAQCDRLFRLPMSEAMDAFPHIVDVGLTGGDPKFDLVQLKADFQLTKPQQKTVLLTFGGLGLKQIPYENLAQFPDWQFITFDANAPSLPNLLQVRDRTYRPVDFLPLCGKVVSKPGYSTFAEALRLDIPIVSLTREGFREANLLLTGIQNQSWHSIITPKEFFSNDWNFLSKPLQPPIKNTIFAKDGVEVISQAVVDYFNQIS